ncbi:hypothetical protein V6N13_147093 [Hibiscus sabdariffa]
MSQQGLQDRQRRAHEKSSNGFEGFLFVTDRELGSSIMEINLGVCLGPFLHGMLHFTSQDKQLEQWNVKAPPVLSLDGHAQGNITTMDEAT